MANLAWYRSLSLLLCFSLWCSLEVISETIGNGSKSTAETKTMVPVGVLLNFNSSFDVVADKCIAMALSDFYATHPSHRTRLLLYRRDAVNVSGAASAAVELINNDKVDAIIGPQTSTQAKFLIELGKDAQIPFISFSASSPSLSTGERSYFIRATPDDSSQVRAIASIIKAYGWHQAVLLYEETEYGNGLVPHLADAFQQIGMRVPYLCAISPSSSEFDILKMLNNLMGHETRVFLVHMSPSLGSKLFLLAKEAGMMSKGYVWIITDGLSISLDYMGSDVIDSMNGVLGIRPFIPKSKRLENFQRKWKSIYQFNKQNTDVSEPNYFSLWAYDAVWALAKAAENAGEKSSDILQPNSTRMIGLFSGLRVSNVGSVLENELINTKFEGLTGTFHLTDGQLQVLAFEIINVVRKEIRVIGYWSREEGLSQNLKSGKVTYSTSRDQLSPPIWPGETKSIPRGWVVPISGQKLRIRVPIRSGFTEYMRMKRDSYTNEPVFSGFSYDVFYAALDKLPFAIPHKMEPFIIGSQEGEGSYDELLYQIKLQKYDAVVGDLMITANRSQYVDFTLPYLESDVAMVVKIKDDQRKNMWIFLRPLSWDLWLTIGIGFLITGFVVWVLERPVNPEFGGPLGQQIGTVLWFSFSILAFAHRERIIHNLTRFVLIIWLFVVLILTQSYTASLASLLTVQRIQPAVMDVEVLKKNGDFVGHRAGSFVKELLIKQLGFEESKLKNYDTEEEFDAALANGSQNGGINAYFDAQHCIKIFLSKYCDKYMTAGQTYKTDGLGFVFPQESRLVSYMSRAILSVTENKTIMESIKKKYFGQEYVCQDHQTSISSDSLTMNSFAGLFIISGVASASALLLYLSGFLRSNWAAIGFIHRERSSLPKIELAMFFGRDDPSRHQPVRSISRLYPVSDSRSAGTGTSNEAVNAVIDEVDETLYSRSNSTPANTGNVM